MSVTDRPGETFDEFTSVGPSAPGFSPEAAPEDRCPPNESAHLRHEAVGGPPRDESAIDSRSPSEVVNGHSSPRNALAPLLKAIQVHDSYLIAETGEGMMVIDQHALHERILYEEFRTRIAQGKMESQRLLVPEPVDMPAGDASALFEQSQILAELGLEVEPFGGDTVLVRSVPAILDRVGPERLVRDLAEHLRSQPLPPSRDGVLAELLHMMACKAAVKAGQPLSAPEITALLERRHLVADSHHCPHGRPTALIFTKADLEKQFGRI
jgi:DNA mismatch repair protein MutL